MKLLDRIKMIQSLTPSEKIFREYLMNNIGSVIYLEEEQVKKEAFVSSSTIYRFCRKLDIKGYESLRLTLAREYKLEHSGEVDYDYPFTETDALETVCKNISTIYTESITHTVHSIDFGELEKVVAILDKSRTICFMTTNTNTQIAEIFRNQLKEIGKNVRISSSPYQWKLEAVNLDRMDTIIINSYAAHSSKALMGILPELRKKGVPIILIGSTHNKSFMPYATCKLFMCDTEHPVNKLHSFSSTISAKYIFDLIYAGLYQINYHDNVEKRRYIYE